MYFHAQKRGQLNKNKSVEQTREQPMTIDNMTVILCHKILMKTLILIFKIPRMIHKIYGLREFKRLASICNKEILAITTWTVKTVERILRMLSYHEIFRSWKEV